MYLHSYVLKLHGYNKLLVLPIYQKYFRFVKMFLTIESLLKYVNKNKKVSNSLFVNIFSKLISILLLSFISNSLFAQVPKHLVLTPSQITAAYVESSKDSSKLTTTVQNCKNFTWYKWVNNKVTKLTTTAPTNPVVIPKPTPWLTIHGNVQYNFNYRSYIDTPFAQENVQAHTVQTNLQVLIKNKYPFTINLQERNSNSPYFANSFDVNVQYNNANIIDKIKNDIRSKTNTLQQLPNITSLENTLHQKQATFSQLQQWLQSPAIAQQLIEEKEQLLQRSKGIKNKITAIENIDEDAIQTQAINMAKNYTEKYSNKNRLQASLLKQYVPSNSHRYDSIAKVVKDTLGNLLATYEASKQKLDSLQQVVKTTNVKLQLAKRAAQDSLQKLQANINIVNNKDGLYEAMQDRNIGKHELTKAQRILLSIEKFGIGRSFIDYSELTVKNTSITGIHIAATPGKYYVAAAAGKVNYRFRDFIFKNSNLPNQPLYVLRAGIGSPGKNHIIATCYQGEKLLLQPTNTPYTTNNYALQKTIGFSIAARYFINTNNSLSVEAAKSSYIGNYAGANTSAQLLKRTTNFTQRGNEAFYVAIQNYIPKTNTSIQAHYKKMGEYFQSFNLQPSNVNQDAWAIQLKQSLFKQHLSIDAAIRKNDFNSSNAIPTLYASQLVFKSLQLTFQKYRYPFVSVGYYPTTQLSLSNGNILSQSQYNTLNTIVSHNYTIASMAMNTNIIFTKFYNKNSDSSFLYFNASNISVQHSLFFNKFTWQTTATASIQKDLTMQSLEQQVGVQIHKKISSMAAIKYNEVKRSTTREILIGGSVGINMILSNIGVIQISYDKTYLPNYDKTLKAVDMGRATYIRTF